MRLSENEKSVIKMEAQKQFGASAIVYIFGSRVDDKKKGGDIDIYIETDIKEDILLKKIQYLVLVKNEIGEQKIDVVINNQTSNKYIYEVAKSEGVII